MTSLLVQTHAEAAVHGIDPSEGEEARLVRDSLAGDARAFDRIVSEHGGRVFRFLSQMTRQRQDAEDLTQQTFVRAFNHLDRFDTRKPLINWLLTIARNAALNHFRSAKRWVEIPEETPASGPTPAGAAEEREQTDNLWNHARSVLSRRQFEVLWLRFGEGLSTSETAQLVGLTETHVKVLIFRARKSLIQEGSMPL